MRLKPKLITELQLNIFRFGWKHHQYLSTARLFGTLTYDVRGLPIDSLIESIYKHVNALGAAAYQLFRLPARC